MAEVKEVKTDAEIMATYFLVKQLRPHLLKDEYAAQIKRLKEHYGYHLIAVIEDGQAKSAAGYRISENLAWSKYLYVDDLITDESSRSKGYAKLLFDWLEIEAKKNNCEQFHLDSGVQRHEAHRFYLNRKMDIKSHHFQKNM